jgi:hypothetical protein
MKFLWTLENVHRVNLYTVNTNIILSGNHHCGNNGCNDIAIIGFLGQENISTDTEIKSMSLFWANILRKLWILT